jgi:beta-xylosidase
LALAPKEKIMHKILFPASLLAILLLTACGGGTVPTPLPVVPPTVTVFPGLYDGFDGAFLLPWTWKEENAAKWSLTENPGYLRIYTAPYADEGRNILLLEVPAGDFTATTHLLYEPSTNFQNAGLTLFVESGIQVTLGRGFCGFIPPCVGNGIYFDYTEEGVAVGESFSAEVTPTNEAWLKLERVGDTLTGSYSADGLTWQVLGTHNLSPFFANARIGLYALQDFEKSDPDLPADFDYFEFIAQP